MRVKTNPKYSLDTGLVQELFQITHTRIHMHRHVTCSTVLQNMGKNFWGTMEIELL